MFLFQTGREDMPPPHAGASAGLKIAKRVSNGPRELRAPQRHRSMCKRPQGTPKHCSEVFNL